MPQTATCQRAGRLRQVSLPAHSPTWWHIILAFSARQSYLAANRQDLHNKVTNEFESSNSSYIQFHPNQVIKYITKQMLRWEQWKCNNPAFFMKLWQTDQPINHPTDGRVVRCPHSHPALCSKLSSWVKRKTSHFLDHTKKIYSHFRLFLLWKKTTLDSLIYVHRKQENRDKRT